MKFHEGHSHDLMTPRKRQFLKCHRRVTPIHKLLHYAFNQANVSTGKLMQVLQACDIRDLYNYERDMREANRAQMHNSS